MLGFAAKSIRGIYSADATVRVNRHLLGWADELDSQSSRQSCWVAIAYGKVQVQEFPGCCAHDPG